MHQNWLPQISGNPTGTVPGTTISEHETVVDECTIRYVQGGSGPPVVLVHGLLGYSFCWRYNLDALASAGHTVVALDLPGVGFSGRCAHLDVGLRTSAERLWRFVDAVGLGRVDVIGSSHGGALSLFATALAPERVRKLVLVSPANPWSRNGHLRLKLLATRPGRLWFHLLEPVLGEVMNETALRQMYGDARRIPPGTLEGYAAPLKIPGTMRHVLQIVRTWEEDMEDLRGTLDDANGALETPTLVLWGDRDVAVDPASANDLMRHLRNAQLKMFSGVGHLPFEECPEEFNREVIEFLGG